MLEAPETALVCRRRLPVDQSTCRCVTLKWLIQPHFKQMAWQASESFLTIDQPSSPHLPPPHRGGVFLEMVFSMAHLTIAPARTEKTTPVMKIKVIIVYPKAPCQEPFARIQTDCSNVARVARCF